MSFQYSKFTFEINNLYKISFSGTRRGLNPFVLNLTITNNITQSYLVNQAELILKTPYMRLTDLNTVKNKYVDQFSLFNKEFDFKIKTELSLSWISMTYHLANELGTSIKAVIEPNKKTLGIYDLSGEIMQKQTKSIKKSFTAQNFPSFIHELEALVHDIDKSFGLETLSWLIV